MPGARLFLRHRAGRPLRRMRAPRRVGLSPVARGRRGSRERGGSRAGPGSTPSIRHRGRNTRPNCSAAAMSATISGSASRFCKSRRKPPPYNCYDQPAGAARRNRSAAYAAEAARPCRRQRVGPLQDARAGAPERAHAGSRHEPARRSSRTVPQSGAAACRSGE